jgi:DNA-binding IclR family transcriptional regulator
MSERDRRLLDAIGRKGVATSADLAQLFGTSRARISVALCRLADLGRIERGPSVGRATPGRPCIRWRLKNGAVA